MSLSDELLDLSKRIAKRITDLEEEKGCLERRVDELEESEAELASEIRRLEASTDLPLHLQSVHADWSKRVSSPDQSAILDALAGLRGGEYAAALLRALE